MDDKIYELKTTICEMICNLITRIDSINIEYSDSGILDSNRLMNFFDDLQVLSEGISIIKDHYSEINLGEFNEKLDMMTRALESGDSMLLADIMFYELKSLLSAWLEILKNTNEKKSLNI